MTETHAPLLAPDFASQTQESFLAHVASLRRLPRHRVKASRPKKAKLAGKFVSQGTLSRPGRYEIAFGALRVSFEFTAKRAADLNRTKVRELSPESFQKLYDALGLNRELLVKFLSAKKFVLP